MQIRLLTLLISILIVSCSQSEDEGFLGEWEGKSIVILSGNPTETSTMAKISDLGNLARECEITVNDLKYDFDAVEGIDILTFTKAPVKNISDSLTQTFVTGTAEIMQDTILVFNHQVITMDGSSIISAIEYNLEFKRTE